ncbi:unnamed protein product [Didymodactylos carnosus]|uniref:ADP ribosyltransferase domain-containing protein n=1 Tax=Didymodactylos carnosus TaxID=1234261 RepID=A0A815NFU9_9BILA|nr:unnamed protein product [Didymodactylos carnosus]CAF4310829.1 unnamed protein product [Didymodactylos carnosus]
MRRNVQDEASVRRKVRRRFDDEDVRKTKQMLQETKANVTFHSNLDGLSNFIDTNPQESFFLVISGVEELKHIEEFETQYQTLDAVKWYTKDTFVYKLINQALRTEDIDALYTLRYYIEDLCSNLKNKYEEFRQLHISLDMPDVMLYRGLRLDRNQILKLKMNEGNLISTNGFLSASRSIDVAKVYAGWDTCYQSTTDTTEPVLFIININVSENKIIVADIAAESQMPDELEVLFDLGSIFEINSITEDYAQKPSKWTIIMTASNDGDKVLNDYILFKLEEMEDFDINIVFGELLYDMGEYKKEEKYFENLLLTKDTPQRRYSLGTVYVLKGEYARALYYLQSAHNQYHEILSSMVSASGNLFNIDEVHNMSSEMARTLVSIANIYFHTDNPDEALINYTSALNVYKTVIPNSNIPHIEICLQNIGLIYEKRDCYNDAMKNFQEADKIYSTTLPDNHPEKAGMLLNIGNIYKLQNNDDLAIKSYTDALDMIKNIYPPNHPLIIEYMNNIGMVHMSNNRYDDALKYFFECLEEKYQEALNIVSSKPSKFEDEASETILGQIYLKLGQFEQAAIHSRNALKLSSNDSNTVRCYTQLGHAYILQHDKTHALICYEKCLKVLRRDTTYEDELANVLINIGAIYLGQNNYNESLSHYSEALKFKRKTDPENPTLISAINRCIARSFFKQDNYDKALEHYFLSLEILKNAENDIEIAKIHEAITISTKI